MPRRGIRFSVEVEARERSANVRTEEEGGVILLFIFNLFSLFSFCFFILNSLNPLLFFCFFLFFSLFNLFVFFPCLLYFILSPFHHQYNPPSLSSSVFFFCLKFFLFFLDLSRKGIRCCRGKEMGVKFSWREEAEGLEGRAREKLSYFFSLWSLKNPWKICGRVKYSAVFRYITFAGVFICFYPRLVFHCLVRVNVLSTFELDYEIRKKTLAFFFFFSVKVSRFHHSPAIHSDF